jgi:dimethylamine/trimethylamine dehydrogenase
MARDQRYDILFEPVKIGPVTAPNRFYQVPHCSGMGSGWPQTLATMRGVKAEGGWGVVCTEYCSIHPSSEDTPYPHCRLWDEDDVRDQALMVEAVHAHGSLAGVELWHGGFHALNRYSREGHMAPKSMPTHGYDPVQARAMDKQDIANILRWQGDAAKRAVRAGFDLVYVYAGHLYLPAQFLSPRFNDRTDEYGGGIENRARLLRELIETTRDAVGGKAAVVVRLMVDEFVGPDGVVAEREGAQVLDLLGELPDLWDVQLGEYYVDARSSRFVKEGAQEPFVAFVKKHTSKPVVGVGRFTSPDTMVSQIKRGVLDMIGAARPSIADPFLPNKIKEGRPEDIRECIGCNICIATNGSGTPIRCTQNPSMGEEWRRGWHPERIAPKHADDTILIVGAGPAGLEAARALGQRGYQVHLAEATDTLGGRIVREAALPGLAEWIRVRDWRQGQIARMPNVSVYRDSKLTAAQVREFGFPHVVIATGSHWRRDGEGRAHHCAIPGHDRRSVLTPDDLRAGAAIEGPALIFDDDHFYMGGVAAERLHALGLAVTLVTPAAEVSRFTEVSGEQSFIQQRLLESGVEIVTHHTLTQIGDGSATIACISTGRERRIEARSVLLVTARRPEETLYRELAADPGALSAAGIVSLTSIGDCRNPGTIAAAVHAGHRYAREFGGSTPDLSFRQEHIRHEARAAAR